ncbi:hypothetical protein HPB47_026272 [Ixodes persulcatus]|uniref:Uncharacterized protein n=1 Tax=Ixodes persulcatus TaxID=34615 RepID=A0AC60PZ64_IXOPE|nr:hypothetical protein HPB47_026272 [Ixodes persulcatus]
MVKPRGEPGKRPRHSPRKKFLRRQVLTDWNRFRTARTATHSEREQDDASLASGTERLVCDKNTYTETINLTTEIAEARHGLIKRWKRQKLNHKLKKRIAAITAEALEYATQLARSNWNTKCKDLQGNLGTKDLLEQLKLRYIRSSPDEEYHDYEGEPNPELDVPFSFEDVWSALQDLGRNTAPGEDCVQDTLLRNLDAGSVWENGELPREWKHSEIILIPKPGKELCLDNLRPIALTSCVGQLMGRVVLKRLQPHMEETGVFSYTMFRFREHLSTQDVMLQLKEDILGPISRLTTQAGLALDVKGAFDNVGHQLILRNLKVINCGSRMYNYLRDFLRNMTAINGAGDFRTDVFDTPDRDTPQGTVLSPTLFSLAMSGLPPILECIPHIKHTLYADDLTIWTVSGSGGEKQDALQAAVDDVQRYLRQGHLHISASKSEFIIVCKTPRSRRKSEPRVEIQVFLDDGSRIPAVSRARILGLHLQEDGKATHTLTLLQNPPAARPQEDDTIKLVNALVVSRIIYSTPYLNLTKGGEDKVDVLIRKASKTALGLPPYISTEELLKLGVHNTFRELVDSHLATQRDRLAQTLRAGRHIWSQIKVHTMPRNMCPKLHAERRNSRARLYQKAYGKRADALYTEAATYAYQRNEATICVVDGTGCTRITALLRTSNTTIAEEFAIAMAIGLGEDHVIIRSDSQTALRRFLAGCVSPKALKIPGHDEVKGNRCADTEARACTLRAAPAATSRLGLDSYFIPVPQRHSEIRAYHRGQRLEYPRHTKISTETGKPHALPSLTAADQLNLIGRARLTADSVGALD